MPRIRPREPESFIPVATITLPEARALYPNLEPPAPPAPEYPALRLSSAQRNEELYADRERPGNIRPVCIDVVRNHLAGIFVYAGQGIADRLVACWNACAGVSTDELDQTTLTDLHADIAALRASNFELSTELAARTQSGQAPTLFGYGDLVEQLRQTNDTLREVHETHIFAPGDRHPADCGYCRMCQENERLLNAASEAPRHLPDADYILTEGALWLEPFGGDVSVRLQFSGRLHVDVYPKGHEDGAPIDNTSLSLEAA